jgi:hypothetical protein
MGLESATYINGLNSSNPTSSDVRSEGDDHIRLLKSTIKATFPNVSGAVTPTHTELNYVDGVTSAIQTQLNNKAAASHTHDTGDITDVLGAAYTPTVNGVTNCASVLARTCFYQWVGDTVVVHGSVTVDPTAGADTLTEVRIEIPISSNFTSSAQLGGTATGIVSGVTVVGYCNADTTNDALLLQFLASSASSVVMWFSAQYQRV